MYSQFSTDGWERNQARAITEIRIMGLDKLAAFEMPHVLLSVNLLSPDATESLRILGCS